MIEFLKKEEEEDKKKGRKKESRIKIENT